MSFFEAFVLGAVQGITEFLPISSSGHLVLFQTLFGMKEPMVAFDVALHVGTLLAVLIYFWKDVGDVGGDFWGSLNRSQAKKEAFSSVLPPPHQGLWVCILITLIPTGLIAVFFKDFFEASFSNLGFVGLAWLVIGILLILSQRLPKGQKDLSVISYGDAFWIGLIQGIALMPGISRSGSTILIGLFLGLRKDAAAKFSFLISIPAIVAAAAMKLKDGTSFFYDYPGQSFLGFLAAAVVGYFVVRWLMQLIQKDRFYLFGYYCIAVSLFAFTIVVFSK